MAQSLDSTCWSLESNRASLRLPQFGAVVDLLKPGEGLSDLTYGGQPVNGFALGVSPCGMPIDSAAEIADVFVRGHDLVATFAQTDQRLFALQVYWRVHQVSESAVQVDTILSLQTCLLESFPNIAVSSTFSNSKAWQLPDSGLEPKPLDETTDLNASQLDGILVRSEGADWSYAERVQPEDRGETHVDTSESGIMLTHRLGGQFLEKGVIRRLRIRGLLIPQENDLEVAAKHLQSLETEEPPLTV